MAKSKRRLQAILGMASMFLLVLSCATPALAASFTDVQADTPHAEHITWLADEGISKGWPNGDGTSSFHPFETVKRCDMAAFLYRLAGEPQFNEDDAPAFSDVDASTPHRRAILWLAHQGISSGWDNHDGTFSFRPYEIVKRCDMAAFLYRLAGEPQVNENEANGFADVDSATPHKRAILWLADAKISTGWDEKDGTKTFRPYLDIVRCDMAAFLHRMDTYLDSQQPPAEKPYELGTYNGFSYVNIKDGSGFNDYDQVVEVPGKDYTTTIFYRGEGIYLYDYEGPATTLKLPATIKGTPVISAEFQKPFVTPEQAPNLQGIDATAARNLVFLQADMDRLTSIAAHGLPELGGLHSTSQALVSLTCHDNPRLTTLYVKDTQLTSIDLSNLPMLVFLTISYNQLASLDISDSPMLSELECEMNNIQDLAPLKQWLEHPGRTGTLEPQRQTTAKPVPGTWNDCTYLYVSEACGYKKYDVITTTESGAPIQYYGPGAYITSIPQNAKSLTLPRTIDNHPLVYAHIACGYQKTELAGINVDAASELRVLTVSNSNLTEFNIAPGTLGKLEKLTVSNCDLTGLHLQGCPNLNSLSIYSTKLSHIDLRQLPKLESLFISNNMLTQLDISPCPDLFQMDCSRNLIADTSALEAWLKQPGHMGSVLPQKDPSSPTKHTKDGFTYIKVNQNTTITWGDVVGQDAEGNDITFRGSGIYIVNTSKSGALALPTSIDGLPVVLVTIPKAATGITSMDARGCKDLKDITVFAPNLTALNVSGVSSLLNLHVANTKLQSLDCSGCTSLFSCYAGFNKLNSINLNGCTKLDNLFLPSNELTSFDVSPFTSLTMLYVQDNRIANTSALEAWLAQPGHSGMATPQRA